MLILMAPEDNSNPSPGDALGSTENNQQPTRRLFNDPIATPSLPVAVPPKHVADVASASSTLAELADTKPATHVNNISDINPVTRPNASEPTSPAAPATTPTKPPRKSRLKLIIGVIVLLLLVGAATTGAFYAGKHKRIVVDVTINKPINLPSSAIVTAACVPGRGKQYIIPKDIPGGPIYDVENSKVIAIEYVIDIQALLNNESNFSSTLLSLVKNYPVDHFDIIPAPAQPGQTGENVHLIMFVVTKSEANKITCSSASTSPSS